MQTGLTRTINASDLQAQCPRIFGEVGRTGEPVTILEPGLPVARLVGMAQQDGARSPQESLRGALRILAKIIEPVLPSADWEAGTR